MAGNTFGKIFKIMTFGESHGPALGVVIDGVPPLLSITESDIQRELNRRRPGQSSVTTPRKESDKVEILSGVFNSKTTGTPIALLLRNKDARSKDYTKFKDIFRPGHADYAYMKKYGIRDWRGGGRASGRETTARVAAGAIAKKILARHGIKVIAYTLAVDGIYAKKINLKSIELNPIRCPDSAQAKVILKRIEDIRESKDSVGGIIEAVVKGCPAGLGDPVFDKLDACLSHAVMSIGAIKGVEFGKGFEVSKMLGSESNDSFCVKSGKIGTATNYAGGILGGISTGEDIVVRVAVKPTSSIGVAQDTVNKSKKSVKIKIDGRHDPCVCPRVVPVVESMIAITVADCLLVQEGVRDISC